MIRRLVRRAALDGAGEICPHSLRVAFITGTREAGVPLEDVQDAAGHADPRTTRRYYREGSGIASGERETAGHQVNKATEWHLRLVYDSCLTRTDRHLIASGAR